MINKISKLAKAFEEKLEEKLLKPVIFIDETSGGRIPDRDGWPTDSWWKQRLYRIVGSEEYLVVSSLYDPPTKECIVFRADNKGNIIDFKELGGYKGTNPDVALEIAGFKLQNEKTAQVPASVQAPNIDRQVQQNLTLNKLYSRLKQRLGENVNFTIDNPTWGTGSLQYKAGKNTNQAPGYYPGLMFTIRIPRIKSYVTNDFPYVQWIDDEVKHIFKDFNYPVSYDIIENPEVPRTNTHQTRSPKLTKVFETKLSKISQVTQNDAIIKNKLWKLGTFLEKNGINKAQFKISDPIYGSGASDYTAGKSTSNKPGLYWIFDITLDSKIPNFKQWKDYIVAGVNKLFSDFNDQVKYSINWY